MKTNYYSFLLMMLSTLLFAQNNDFNNAGGNLLWSNPANWTLNAVPTLSNATAVRLPLLVESNVDTNVSIRKIQNLFGAAGNISVGGTGIMTIDAGAANAYAIENVTENNHQLNFKGNVTINNAAGFSRIRNLNGTQNTIRFDAGSTLTLITALELFTGSNNAGYVFNGALAGPANFRLAAGVTATFGATSNNTNYSGEFVFLANSNLIVNTADNGLFYSGLKFQVNGSGGTVTFNGANVFQSGISVGAANVFNAVFNKNQSAMTNIIFGGAGNLNLTIGAEVTNLSFANNSDNNWSTGTLNIINFEDGIIRFGTDNTGLTSDQLAQINAPAAGEPLALDSNGFLVRQSSLSVGNFEVTNNPILINTITMNKLEFSKPQNQVTVIDINGRVVMNDNQINQEYLNVQSLTAGIYLAIFENNIIEKFIKK
ncbi:MAG: T9SS type A sorting domain-containing protein [Flavobacterium sp.]